MAHRDLAVDSSSWVLLWEQLSKWALALSPSSLPLRGPWVQLQPYIWTFLRMSSPIRTTHGRNHTFFPSEIREGVSMWAPVGPGQMKEVLTGEAVPTSPLPPLALPLRTALLQ